MSEETLYTAARRLIRNVRADETDGGLLSNSTVRAALVLSRLVDVETIRLKNSKDPWERAQVYGDEPQGHKP